MFVLDLSPAGMWKPRLSVVGSWLSRIAGLIENRQPRTENSFQHSYPIDLFAHLHGFDNERAKFAIKRVKLAVGGAK